MSELEGPLEFLSPDGETEARAGSDMPWGHMESVGSSVLLPLHSPPHPSLYPCSVLPWPRSPLRQPALPLCICLPHGKRDSDPFGMRTFQEEILALSRWENLGGEKGPDLGHLSLVPTPSPAGGTGRAFPWQRDAVQDGVQLRGERVLRARMEAAPGV